METRAAGCSARNPLTISGSKYVLTENAAATVTIPPSLDWAASSACRPSSTVLSRRSAIGRNTLPALVNRTPRPVRSKSRCRSVASRTCTRALTEGCVRNSEAAALAKLP